MFLLFLNEALCLLCAACWRQPQDAAPAPAASQCPHLLLSCTEMRRFLTHNSDMRTEHWIQCNFCFHATAPSSALYILRRAYKQRHPSTALPQAPKCQRFAGIVDDGILLRLVSLLIASYCVFVYTENTESYVIRCNRDMPAGYLWTCDTCFGVTSMWCRPARPVLRCHCWNPVCRWTMFLAVIFGHGLSLIPQTSVDRLCSHSFPRCAMLMHYKMPC